MHGIVKVCLPATDDSSLVQCRPRSANVHPLYSRRIQSIRALISKLFPIFALIYDQVLGVDNRGNVIAVRPKYAQFTWVGPSVSGLKKGQAGPQRDKLKKVFHGVSLEIQVDDLEDFTQESIARRLLAR